MIKENLLAVNEYLEKAAKNVEFVEGDVNVLYAKYVYRNHKDSWSGEQRISLVGVFTIKGEKPTPLGVGWIA